MICSVNQRLGRPEGWELAALTTAGADGRFLDADGNTVGVFQVKASDRADLVSEHLDRYPEVDTVITTSDAAEDADGIDGVADSGIGFDELIPGGRTSTSSPRPSWMAWAS